MSRFPARPRRPRRSKAFLAELRRQCMVADESDRRESEHRRDRALNLGAQYLEAAMDAARESEARAWVGDLKKR